MNNVSPLRYPGGKTRACKQLDIILNNHFDVSKFNILISPFFGGGSFEFFLQNKYNFTILANDKFYPLANFWNVCKINNDKLCTQLALCQHDIDKDVFSRFRQQIDVNNKNNKDSLEQAVMFFVINRCSFSGATLSGGYSQQSATNRFTSSSIQRIRNLNLERFSMSNKDFEDFLESTNSQDNTLLFLDPPYYLEGSSNKLYGNNGDMHESFDHEKLYRLLNTKINWFITYNDCEYIRTLYRDYTIIDTAWSYGMNKTKKSSEIVILKMFTT